jgi:hypothetical protein
MTNLSNEEITLKAGELTQREGCKVHPLVFEDNGVQVIGFIKEPPRHVKLRVMDKGLTSPVTAASEVLDAYLLKDVSDSRIFDEKPENDVYYLGATMEAYNMITMAINQFKKK